MATLLRLDSSARQSGSHSRTLGDRFQKRWENNNVESEVLVRDLAQEPLNHLYDALIRAFQEPEKSAIPDIELSDELIGQLKKADHLLITCPLYNFSVPSSLKAYLDYIVRSGETFQYEESGLRGLLTNKNATVIMTRGAVAERDKQDDFATSYLDQILKTIGFENVETIIFEGTMLADSEREWQKQLAERQIDSCFRQVDPVAWEGSFDHYDKQKINALRNGQAQAIVNGDALAYARLCAENVTLMVPGQDIVLGRDKVQEVEKRLFSQHDFEEFFKFPVKVVRQGNFAVEYGRQTAKVRDCSNKQGVTANSQKYQHIYRYDKGEWLFYSLMSNASE